MSARLPRAGMATLLLLVACAAPGTDLEALPFYREDRTGLPIVSVDVPPLLMDLDAADLPPRSPDEPNGEPTREPSGGPAQVAPVDSAGSPVTESPVSESPVTESHLALRFPWPLGLWLKEGNRHSFTLTAVLGADTSRNAGPLGRALSAREGVPKNPIPALGSDPEPGGIMSLPLTFWDTQVDHGDLPDVPGTDLDRDISLLPLFAWGGGDGEEHDYLAVFPFGGTTKELIGKEKITWYGFPLPAYAEVEDRAYHSTHILWPFVNFVDGPRHQGMRVLPFWGHYEHQDSFGRPVYERSYLMWPFLTWQRTGLNEPAGPTEIFFAFPFYGRIHGPGRNNVTVLWPFFRWETDDLVDSWELRAPFPFLILGGGDERYRLDLWPLMGFRGRRGFDRQFLLWPLFRHESLDAGRSRFQGLWFLPLFWRTSWQDEDGKSETRVRVWPLLHYRHLRDGSADLALLSPWPKDDPDGFERILGPFLRLYRWHRDADGGSEHQVLLGLGSWRSLPAVEADAVRPARAPYWRLSLLFGLFHLRQLGDQTGLRLFWLPEITWGGGEP